MSTELIIFGATGDLVAKKIVPALFHLFEKKRLPADFRVVGVSRRPITTAEFREKVKGMDSRLRGNDAKEFIELFSFHQLQFENETDYRSLVSSLAVASNRLIYLAVPPEQYPVIFEHLKSSSLVARSSSQKQWSRIIVEKPFGMDAAHAEAIEEQLAKLVDESQIYRIDHYLAKDMLQNVLNFRFSNNLFEDNWNAKEIESIRIRLWETIGVEHRGAFYDRIGALRDVGQNHLLQMLALVTMDRPASFRAEDIRARRAEILQKLHIPSADEISRETFRAQYDGYQSIAGVRPDSDTETYCRVVARLESPRWEGVPITMDAGKRMPEQRKEIVVTFRAPFGNKIVFSLEPTEGITIRFFAKKIGLDTELEERSFDFIHRDPSHHHQYVAEYEKLLLDCIAGDQSLFVSTDEVRAMWRFTDPIAAAWKGNFVPLAPYSDGLLS